MARAKRHYLPGQIWHLAHRCHKREFLLKLVQDRRNWVQWLFEAEKRYGLVIRKGAFWEDRYHATAVESEHHLNMVRAGVVSHPSEWPFGGYGEIQVPRRKSVLIAHQKLASLAGFATYDAFRDTHKELVTSFRL